jgi:D-2-hydroxyacid dehydrogenase (NADP+)
MAERFALRNTGIRHFQVRTFDALADRIASADVLAVSSLWRNALIAPALKLRFIQSVSTGVDQYCRDTLRERGIRLAAGSGTTERAVAEHTMALILALVRQLHLARDNQKRRLWRGLSPHITLREDELGGKTLLVVGLGRIGSRLAALARAFGMRVIATKRNPASAAEAADAVFAHDRLIDLLPQADIVALTCPLTPQTDRLIDAKALAAMKPSAFLVNVARGRVVDEPALVAALEGERLAGVALDCVWEEPLPAASPLWSFDRVLITPHVAGETHRKEDNVIDLLLENLGRLWRGEAALKNEIL